MNSIIRPSATYILPGLVKYNYNERTVVRDICNYFGITPEEIKSKSRLTKIRMPRQIAMYFMKKMFGKQSLHSIGVFFLRDHATVIHSIKAVQNQIDTEPEFRQMIDKIESIIIYGKQESKIVS